jgi:hypothetical protein
MKLRPPRLYFFRDGGSIRLRSSEREFVARLFRRQRVRSKALLDELIGTYFY